MQFSKRRGKYIAIGLMSGTSLDGLDIALCEFEYKTNAWRYAIIAAETIAYSVSRKRQLQDSYSLSAEDFWKLHIDFGHYMAGEVNSFIQKRNVEKPDFIASHGHTVFHQPGQHFTCQIGDGSSLAALTGIKTICDFRSGDIALGGQGAPLVPIGDELLFAVYDSCLNIGGIANISFRKNNKRLAFDICPANILFNHLASKKQLPFDKNGKIAASGKIDALLLDRLNAIDFYKVENKKSLGREWVEKWLIPLLEQRDISIEDKMATVVEHVAQQIAAVVNKQELKTMLLSGGGTYHVFLRERLAAYTPCELVVPDNKTIEFKEALIFAFLGLLRLLEQENCLSSVTGAIRNSVGGAIYL